MAKDRIESKYVTVAPGVELHILEKGEKQQLDRNCTAVICKNFQCMNISNSYTMLKQQHVHDEQAQHLSAAVFLLYKTSLWMTVRFDFELCRFSFYLKL